MFSKLKFIFLLFFILFILLIFFYFFNFKSIYFIDNNIKSVSNEVIVNNKKDFNVKNVDEKELILSQQIKDLYKGDIPNQTQLINPPKIIKGIYATGWSAGSDKKINQLISIIKKNNFNAIVIDIKDYSGHLSYFIENKIAKESGALNEIKILYPNKLIKKLHDENIYVIGRITVFQDPIFSKKFPEYSIKNKLNNELWKDNKGLSWVDPQNNQYWDYILEISRDAWNRGFDELNFDYIRFPSDGNLDTMSFPFWDENIPKHEVIKNFFIYLRNNLKDIKISADIFGLTTISKDDLGIGQIIEDAYNYFDIVCPMIYPSHFSSGSFGYKNPAEYPYEVIYNSMNQALKRVEINASSIAILRPWLQVFDLDTKYDKKMIDAQIQAVEDVLLQTKYFGGYLFWDPNNNYFDL